MDLLIDWLRENIPVGDAATVVHGDYRMENTILHPDEPRILAVLDWELSTLGHPLADLAYNCISYHLPSGELSGYGYLGLNLPAFRNSFQRPIMCRLIAGEPEGRAFTAGLFLSLSACFAWRP